MSDGRYILEWNGNFDVVQFLFVTEINDVLRTYENTLGAPGNFLTTNERKIGVLVLYLL